MVLARQPVCADPFGIHAERGEVVVATEVDHIVPKRLGGRDEIENLQALCKSCHSRKTMMERSGVVAGDGHRRTATVVCGAEPVGEQVVAADEEG